MPYGFSLLASASFGKFVNSRQVGRMRKKVFNTTGICYADEHYMVDLTERLEAIRKMIDRGKYFVINRARQYGKTTLLHALGEVLCDSYIVVQMDFQKFGTLSFENEQVFTKAFSKFFWNAFVNEMTLKGNSSKEEFSERIRNAASLSELFEEVSLLCGVAEKPIVLMIDEVDSASNNQVFLDFLAQLRAYYLDRRKVPAFQSVILASVYDIKNLKIKIRPEETHRYNSPWNIAEQFTIDLSFSIADIAGMLEEYEKEHETEMDIEAVSKELYDYTAGYPYLVSRLCQKLDEEELGWRHEGILCAVKMLLKESNTLFDDMQKKITEYPDLKTMLYAMLFNGRMFPYHEQNALMSIGTMFGFIKEKDGQAEIANRIFESWFYNLFISEEALNSEIYDAGLLTKIRFVKGGKLDMDLILQKFMEYFTEIYKDSSDKFIEENGRRLFLLYLKPIINGTGNYYVEARIRSMGRTDVIVDYSGQQYVIEMKIWRGNEYNERGEKQLLEYLEDYDLKKGYMISFNFNKNKQTSMKELHFGERSLLEIVV